MNYHGVAIMTDTDNSKLKAIIKIFIFIKII